MLSDPNNSRRLSFAEQCRVNRFTDARIQRYLRRRRGNVRVTNDDRIFCRSCLEEERYGQRVDDGSLADMGPASESCQNCGKS